MPYPCLNTEELAAVVGLVASAQPRVVIEFGVNLGHTARAILYAVQSIERYIGIDVPWGFETALECQRKEVPVNAGLFVKHDPRFFLLRCERGSRYLTPDELEPVDAAFIDGDHSAVGVIADSFLARAILRPGGIIVWHDYTNPGVEVTAALDKLIADGWPIVHVPHTWLAYMRISK